jgi:hypothetical protein
VELLGDPDPFRDLEFITGTAFSPIQDTSAFATSP